MEQLGLLESLKTLTHSLKDRLGASTGTGELPSFVPLDLHSIKSLLAQGNETEYRQRCHEVEQAVLSGKPGAATDLATFLEELVLRLDQPFSTFETAAASELWIPPLVMSPPALSLDDIHFLDSGMERELRVIRLVLDPDDGLPLVRLRLVLRRLEDQLVLVRYWTWVWKTEGTWDLVDPQDLEHLDSDARVYWRGLVHSPSGEGPIRTALTMGGIATLSIQPWTPRFDTAPSRIHDLQDGVLDARNNDIQTNLPRPGADQESLVGLCTEWISYGHGLAREQGKLLSSLWIAEETDLGKEVLSRLSAGILQLIRNSLRHGIKDPASRLKDDKAPSGLLTALLYGSSEHIHLEVHDDGTGIDVLSLSERSQEGQQELLSGEALRDVLASRGMSLADTRDIHGGAGLGLTVLDTLVTRELWGDWHVETWPGKGTSISMHLPRGLVELDVRVFRYHGFHWACPLVRLAGVRRFRKKNLGRDADGNYVATICGGHVTVDQIWAGAGLDMPGIDELWPSDEIDMAILVHRHRLFKAIPIHQACHDEACVVPLRAESVWSKTMGTWVPLVE